MATSVPGCSQKGEGQASIDINIIFREGRILVGGTLAVIACHIR